MNLTIIGTGYVGLVTGACLADLGHTVCCLDLDVAKIDLLTAGGLPIHEAGLRELIERNRAAERLRFSTDVAEAVVFGDVLFIAVGTPPDEDGSADIQHVLAAASDIGRYLDAFKVVVNKSTVPVGTTDQVRSVIEQALCQRGRSDMAFAVLSNPEFLQEGLAVRDFMHPDRIVIGAADSVEAQRGVAILRQIYVPVCRDHGCIQVMDVRSAELTKYAANAMLATRISFMNDLANLADAVGADIEHVRLGIGADARIGPSYLHAGVGYGGGCFPKDVRALASAGRRQGRPLRLLEAVDAVNNDQKKVLLHKVEAHFGADLSDRCFAIWGLAFKPQTSDMREAPSRAVIAGLLRAGASIQAHDPVAIADARRVLAQDLADAPDLFARIEFADSAVNALQGADALLLLTEWPDYLTPDWMTVKNILRLPLVFDGRNAYEPLQLSAVGLRHIGIGRRGQGFGEVT